LVANRGEIAIRVMRAASELGLRTVAIYSQEDRFSLHRTKADESYLVGRGKGPIEAYLDIEDILRTAREARVDAIHPGYGFLSENPEFAQACAAAGIVFVGPRPDTMRTLGNKVAARQRMEAAGLPVVPGTSRGVESPEEAATIAGKIGYPVMLKAAAGGGGKGMRMIQRAEELKSALESASSEALRAFGDGEIYIEKAIVNPRHIEMQVLADEHGNTVYLGERECSLQRRHQKVLEEAPSPFVDSEMRRRMGEVAVRVAQAAGYTNAGTVEFLVD